MTDIVSPGLSQRGAGSAVADAAEREAALEARHSCIVQAPAGSGKTGLLIQRYLRLLAGVERPEEILAITFTRKAAAEMRRRVLQALEGAARGDAIGEAPHARLTRTLAAAALARDRERGWRLLDNPARLRIQTIDALCASLARQMPVLSGVGASASIVEDARELHREAAERTLAHLEASGALAAALRRFLVHLDGDWAAARALLEAMLARRDQWIERVAGFEADHSARTMLEEAFRGERARLLGRMRALLPPEEEAELARLAAYAGANARRSKSDSPIVRLDGMTRLPPAAEEGAEDWLAIARLLLTKQGAWRAQVDRRTGFPPAGHADAAQFRQRMKRLLARLCTVPGLCEALHALRGMPPACFTDAQWEALGAVVAILPHAVAELQLVFAEHGAIDFTGLAQAAVAALGDEDDPTDLLLALDVRVRHLLVDEFQDTSRSQWKLLERLTAGWIEDDGRTVFLVGDPMQSIYRFREADVALFLRAREQGLPQARLVPLRLATNFRSQAGLVAWVNQAFGQVLPAAEDADAGAVPHSPSSPHHPARAGNAVQWHPCLRRDAATARQAEARKVAQIARDTLASSLTETVAILVRNRSHLDRIVPELKRANVRFRAVDIEPLGARAMIQDLLAIARALSHPGDRVAWLSLARAPWCALGAADLHALAGVEADSASGRKTVWELLHDEKRLAAMAPEARERVRRMREILAPFVEHRLRGSVRERVEGAWLALGGPACASLESDLEDAETFFDQLDELESGGDIPDPAVLEEHLAELYAAPDSGGEARVQVMTIHKAKGLEFGTVILPGLDRMPRASERPLFAWKARADGTLLMAPVRAAGETEEPAYDYLLGLDQAAADHELERLLYVAATRAAHRLHLLGYVRVEEKNGTLQLREPSRRSLLGKAWCVAKPEFERALGEADLSPSAASEAKASQDELRVLSPATLAIDVPPARAPVIAPAVQSATSIEFSWVGETARHVGIVVHGWLQRIAREGVERWDAARIPRIERAVERDLARRGIPEAERAAARRRVLRALAGAIEDERGRWLLRARPGARSEYRLRVAGAEGVRLVVIDRTFVDDDGRRWIVDYKTGAHEGAEPERFLDRELERYRAQLVGYAAAFPGEAVSLGLYFPLLRGWRELVA
ncbi:MAG TPA: UvrD-helicase domain-containing protein [Usitatibacter sp.]|nr:UvrD-helicase domain-containing protein [Usitatibacter sp.]